MASENCTCCSCSNKSNQSGLPLMCLVPRGDSKDFNKYFAQDTPKNDTYHDSEKHSTLHKKKMKFKLLSDEYIKKNFKLPPRALYLDPFRRPLITFPISHEGVVNNFTTDRKAKINQAILDGILDSSAQICQPSVFPYGEKTYEKNKEKKHENTEMIYILQLPDLEHKCPVHNEIVRTPRFIWHSDKKSETDKQGAAKVARGEGGHVQGGGPLNKPKPWLLSRHTDFDYYSQW